MAYPFSLKCACGVIIWQGREFPKFCSIICPKCKKKSNIDKPKPPPKKESIKMTAPEVIEQAVTTLHPVNVDQKSIRMKA